MPEFPEEIESIFRYILIAAKRAEQLVVGARPRITTRHVKPTTIAIAELAANRVPWRSVTAEEYELLLQQEVAAKEAEEHAPVLFPTVAPLLPVVVEPEAEAEEEEEEEEAEEVEEELQGPKFDENLEVVEEPVAEELLPAEEITEE